MTHDCIKADLTAIDREGIACIEMVQRQKIVKNVLKLLVIKKTANFSAVKTGPVSPRKFVSHSLYDYRLKYINPL